MNKKKVIIVGGGTGGHLFPAIAISEILQDNYEICLITDNRCKAYIPSDIKHRIEIIDVERFSFSPLKFITSLYLNIKSFYTSLKLINNFKPDLIIGCGGYTSIPILLCSIIKRIKIVLHEQNSIVGRVNLLFSRFANKIFISFMHTTKLPKIDGNKIIWSGNPTPSKISLVNKNKMLKNNNFTIVVTGGSQAALIFDHIVPESIQIIKNSLKDLNLTIIQQIKSPNTVHLEGFYKELGVNYEIANFFKDIDSKYSQADLIVARAGASTISDLIVTNIPSILVPYPYAKDNHQFTNALNLVKFNAAIMIDQKKLTSKLLAQNIIDLINNRDRLEGMTVALKNLNIDSKKIITEEINKLFDKKNIFATLD